MSPADLDLFYRRTGIGEENFALLKKLSLFSNLNNNDLRNLLQSSSVRRYSNGSTLFMQEDPADQFYVVFDGWVKLFRATEDGYETVIAVITAGETFAEAAIFGRHTFPVTATVVSDVTLLVIPAKPFLGSLRGNFDLCLNIMGAVSFHNRHLVSQVEKMTVRSSAERLAMFLSDMCHETSGPEEIFLPHDKSLIAARLGMQPETLSRSLAKLRKVGVQTKGEKIMIEDVLVLKRYPEAKLCK